MHVQEIKLVSQKSYMCKIVHRFLRRIHLTTVVSTSPLQWNGQYMRSQRGGGERRERGIR